ncbi:hypothetical protein E3G68_005207 [Mycobacteroides abscessus]|nr:hypothetical protein [Mycobacteroides abscessus]
MLDESGALPTGEDSPMRSVKRPPLHRLPSPAGNSSGSLRPNPMRPRRCHGQIPGHHLCGSQTQLDKSMWIVEIADAQIISKLIDPQSPTRTRHRRELEHRISPLGDIAERLPARGLRLPRDIPDVIVRMIGAAAPLRPVLVQRVARLSGRRRINVRKNAVNEHSGCPAPHLGVQCLKHRGRTVCQQDVEWSRTAEIDIRAFQPHPGRVATPDQPRA